MSLMFEDVSLALIGKGGLNGDRTLIQQAEDELQRLAQIVHEPGRGDTATITLTIKVKAVNKGDPDNRQLQISGGMKATEPKRDIRALAAFVTDDGQLLTAQAKQQSLPNVTPLRPRDEASGE